ncbi:MAG: Rha family transcriptional regulator [Magnetococcales bacterium]|nr:Rha family transcriptional regulator [Magnetococcales bacterium]MBF0115492.1 Rha family transcriptional regulator [Magnetococcales bacterium]
MHDATAVLPKTKNRLPRPISEMDVPKIHVSFINGNAIVSSKEVAEKFGKLHKDVLEAIRNLKKECPVWFTERNFPPSDYLDPSGRRLPMFNLTEDGFTLLVMGFQGEEAIKWKIRFLDAFRALRQEVLRYHAAGIRMDSPALVDALFDGQLTIFRAKQIQDFTPEEQQQILELPKREIARTIKNLKMLKSGGQAAMASLSGVNEWYTPSKWIEMARTVMGSIDVDPASHYVAQRMVQADDWHDQERDGLKYDWPGNVWLNPPYARGLIDQFVDKLLDQVAAGETKQAVVLVDSRTDTKWFNKLCSMASAVAFTRGRVHFYNETAKASSPVCGSAFFYFGQRAQKFKQSFDADCMVFFAPPVSVEETTNGWRKSNALGLRNQGMFQYQETPKNRSVCRMFPGQHPDG